MHPDGLVLRPGKGTLAKGVFPEGHSSQSEMRYPWGRLKWTVAHGEQLEFAGIVPRESNVA